MARLERDIYLAHFASFISKSSQCITLHLLSIYQEKLTNLPTGQTGYTQINNPQKKVLYG